MYQAIAATCPCIYTTVYSSFYRINRFLLKNDIGLGNSNSTKTFCSPKKRSEEKWMMAVFRLLLGNLQLNK